MGIIDNLLKRFARTPTAQKYYLDGMPNIWGGTIGTNRDFALNKWGASLAVTVNEAIYACVAIRARTVGGTAWRIVDNGTGEIITDHNDTETTNALARAIIRYQRRAQESLFLRWELSRVVTGETYIELARNDFGYPADLEWLNPLGVSINAPYGIPETYLYAFYGRSETFDNKNLVYDRLSMNMQDEVYGYSPVMVSIGSRTLDVSRNSQRVLAAFFRNDATPHKVMTPPNNGASQDITGWSPMQVDRIKQQLQSQNMGVDNAYRFSVFPFPLNLIEPTLPDLDKWSELLRSIEPRIYTALGVPRSVAGDSDSTRYQASPDDVPNFHRTIVNELRHMQAVVNARLVPFFAQDAKPTWRFEFDLSAYETVNPENAKLASSAFLDGAITLNEYRKELGKDTLPNGDAILIKTGAALVPLADIGKPLEPITPTPMSTPPNAPDEPPTKSAKAVPDKYAHIDFSPTDGMKEEARRALAWREEFGRGGTQVGLTRANQIIRDATLSPETTRRMKAYFDRHQVDKQAEGFEVGEKGYPSNGRIAYGLWGGEAGYSWAKKRVEQMNAADNAEKAKDLKAWYRRAKNAGAQKAIAFKPDVIPDEDAQEIRYYLAQGDLSVFARFRAVYEDNHSLYVNERIEKLIDAYKAMLKEAHDTINARADESAVKSFARDVLRAKSIQSTRINFELGIEETFALAISGGMNKRTFKMRLNQLIRGWGYQAYLDGLRDAGVIVSDLDGLDLEDYERFADEQRRYVDNVADAVFIDESVNPNQVEQKGVMWSNKSLMPFYYAGLESGAKDGVFEWVMGPTEEHCRSCSALSGQRRRMKFWQKTIIPKSGGLACKGFLCKCEIIRTTLPVSRGRLPNWG